MPAGWRVGRSASARPASAVRAAAARICCCLLALLLASSHFASDRVGGARRAAVAAAGCVRPVALSAAPAAAAQLDAPERAALSAAPVDGCALRAAPISAARPLRCCSLGGFTHGTTLASVAILSVCKTCARRSAEQQHACRSCDQLVTHHNALLVGASAARFNAALTLLLDQRVQGAGVPKTGDRASIARELPGRSGKIVCGNVAPDGNLSWFARARRSGTAATGKSRAPAHISRDEGNRRMGRKGDCEPFATLRSRERKQSHRKPELLVASRNNGMSCFVDVATRWGLRMPTDTSGDPVQRWRMLAADAHATAEQTTDPEARRSYSPSQKVTRDLRRGPRSWPSDLARRISSNLELDPRFECSSRMDKPVRLVDNAEHWKARATETRQLADAQTDDQTKRALLDIAAEFDKLAALAERRRQGLAGY